MNTAIKLFCMLGSVIACSAQLLGMDKPLHGLTAIALATCFYLSVKIDKETRDE